VENTLISQNIRTLINLGLEDKEAEIYLAALKTGGGTIMELARTGQIERTGIYYHVDKLIKAGLIKEVQKGKRKIYLPADPNRLKTILAQKEQNLKKTLPELEKIFTAQTSKSVSSYYQGKDGIINLYEQLYEIASSMKSPEDKYYIFGHSFEAYEALPDFFPEYIQKRAKLPISTKIILPSSEKPDKRILKRAADPIVVAKYNLHIKERKYLDKKYEYPGTTLILGDYVATIDFRTYFGTLIQNKNLAQTWRMFFEFIWDSLK